MNHDFLKRVLLCFLAVGFAGWVLFGNISEGVAQEPINVGFNFDFSGVTAGVGNREAPVVEMVVKQVNAAGGINGRQIKLYTLDNGADPGRVVGNLKMLREVHKCPVILSGINSSCGIAAMGWALQNRVPVITEGAATDQVTVVGQKTWFFKTLGSLSTYAMAALLRFKNLGHTKVAVEATTLAFGTDMVRNVEKYAPQYGIKVVEVIRCEPKSKDLAIQATRLRESGANAVFFGDYETETVVWERALKTIGWRPHMYHGGPGLLFSAMKISPPGTFEGWETCSTVDDGKPLVKKVLEEYEAYTKSGLGDDMIPRTWDAIQLILEALRLSGNPDSPEAIREGFYKIKDFEIAQGVIGAKGSFIDKNDLLQPEDILTYVVKGGKLAVVR